MMGEYNFTKYRPQHSGHKVMTVRFNERRMYLTLVAYRAIGEPAYVDLYVDNMKRAILVAPSESGIMKVSTSKGDGKTASVCVKDFVDRYKIEPGIYRASRYNSRGLVVDLNEFAASKKTNMKGGE